MKVESLQLKLERTLCGFILFLSKCILPCWN